MLRLASGTIKMYVNAILRIFSSKVITVYSKVFEKEQPTFYV